MSGIKICLTGSGSKWLTLPATPEEARAAFQNVGAKDGEVRVAGCETGFGGKLDPMIIGANLDVVNYLAARLEHLSPDHTELLEAILESPLGSDLLHGIEQVIDFTHNTDVYEIYGSVHSPEDLARYYISESGLIQMPSEWVEGIDLERFGKNLEKHEPGYYTRCGYLIATGLTWETVFEKSGEVPPEYRIV